MSFPLIVDPRAGSKTLIPVLRALGTRVEVEQMEFGDVAFAGNGPEGVLSIGFEHKTLADVMACMIDGRFADHQLPGLKTAYDVVYLVVQGQWKPSPEGELLIRDGKKWERVPGRNRRPWFYSAVQGWLWTMRFQGGVIPVQCADLAASCAFIKSEHSSWQKEWAAHDSLKVFHSVTGPCVVRPGITRRFAKEVPGIGWDLSDRVARHFGTPRKMVNASAAEWEEIPKVGKTIANRAVWLFQHGDERKRK